MTGRLSDDLKHLKGTKRASRDPSPAFEPLRDVPEPPDYLSAAAVREWHRIAPQAVAVGMAEADLRALGLLCETLATEAALKGVIDLEGVTIESGSGARKAHPALNALAQARTQAASLMSAFGLNPRGRQALPTPKGLLKPWQKNPFDEFV